MSDEVKKKEILKGKPLSLSVKIAAAILFLGLLAYKLITTGDLSVQYVLACGLASLILANIFISVDISLWITNWKKIRGDV